VRSDNARDWRVNIMRRGTPAEEPTMSRALLASARRVRDGLAIAAALAAVMIAILAAIGLFVMAGRLSQRRTNIETASVHSAASSEGSR
jgi:hypothetical protein